ncbi:MAG: DUF2059 domain-containing protein [Gemmobacter sp.]
MPLIALRLVLAVLALGVPALAPASLRAETPVEAPAAATAGDLSRILMIPGIIAVMRDEGLAYGASLEDEMFPGRGGPSWDATVALVYDEPAMLGRFQTAFEAALHDDPATRSAIAAWFDTPLGQRILRLEIEARRTLMDEAVEEAAIERTARMVADDDPRMDALRDFAQANDLIEQNVQGALNANLGFYQGMAEVGAFGGDMTEEQMLSDVWAQETQIRDETEAWLYPFMALAYGPLSEAELRGYTDFSRTPAGRKLNAALFAAFDAVFVQISRDLGRAAARQMIGDDI